MKIKKLISLFLIILIITCSCISVNALETTQEPSISAQSAVVMCADSSDVIYSKNMDEKLPMASTTKIMTALLCLEEPDAKTRVITITPEMVAVEGSSMGLKAGNQLTLYALAQGMLTVSGNDAANSAAIAISGSQEAFADKMNEKAQQIGMTNTHFITPSGLDDDDHYSTAYDMAILGAYAMDNDLFREISSSKTSKVEFVSPKRTISYHNENKLLSLYDGCIGIKTGFTKKSGRCLVSAAERDEIRLVAVTLNDPNDWEDHEKLLDYGFNNATKISIDDTNISVQENVVGGTEDEVTVSPMFNTDIVLNKNTSTNLEKKILLPPFVYAPVSEGDILGKVQYLSDDKVVASVDLVAQRSVEYDRGGFLNHLKGLFKFG